MRSPVSCSRRSLKSTRSTKKHWSDKGLFNRGDVPVLGLSQLHLMLFSHAACEWRAPRHCRNISVISGCFCGSQKTFKKIFRGCLEGLWGNTTPYTGVLIVRICAGLAERIFHSFIPLLECVFFEYFPEKKFSKTPNFKLWLKVTLCHNRSWQDGICLTACSRLC